jgi:hypothetical protein
MAFIDKKNPVVLNIKLTSKGRELLAAGELDFKYFALGDSEIDYRFNASVNAEDSEYTAFDSSVLQPVDKNPRIISFISKDVSDNTFNELSSVPVTAFNVENQVDSLGFFTNLSTTPEFITDSNHVKQPDLMIYMTGVTGGNSVALKKAPDFGTSGESLAVGDLLLIKWTTSGSTTGHTITTSSPQQYLWYQITGIISGSLGSNNIVVELDRPIPNFSGMTLSPDLKAGVLTYYNEINFSGDTVFNLTPTEYVDESILSFLENSQCPTIVFPYWNMSIIYTEEIAGVQASDLKYTQFKNRNFGGFVSYIQNQAPVNKKLGVVHYTNNSPANVYAEGFLLKTLELDIPTIMWHRSETPKLGAKFIAHGSVKLLTGATKSLNIEYYDLVDKDNTNVVVGKVFNNLKIVVIEDQELLYAMEYKSNRNFTLPNYDASTNTITINQPPPPPVIDKCVDFQLINQDSGSGYENKVMCITTNPPISSGECFRLCLDNSLYGEGAGDYGYGYASNYITCNSNYAGGGYAGGGYDIFGTCCNTCDFTTDFTYKYGDGVIVEMNVMADAGSGYGYGASEACVCLTADSLAGGGSFQNGSTCTCVCINTDSLG